jgi:DNA-binding NtrC family response regulator
MGRILIIDDDSGQRELMRAVLEQDGHVCTSAADGIRGLEACTRDRPDLVLLDLRLPGLDGIGVLGRLRGEGCEARVVLITAYGDVETAVTAMKLGAADFIEKPIEIDRLRSVIAGLLERAETAGATGAERAVDEPAEFVGVSAAGKRVRELVRVAAGSDATVLITGPSGTGKEIVARAIHRLGPRRAGPFVAINCAAVPETLLEAALFGHEKGAFTGAEARREGCFEAARGGTLLLDEVAEMGLAVQGKLLRVLQERAVVRLGSNRPIPVDVRVVAATNRDVGPDLASSRLREDLYFRLNVLGIGIPPLEERPEDVLPLARHFVARHDGTHHRNITAATTRRLLAHRWPGNARELENTIERALLFAKGVDILPEHLPPGLGETGEGAAGLETGVRPGFCIEDVERDLILKTLESLGGNRTRAAEALGLSRRTLQIKLKRYGVR